MALLKCDDCGREVSSKALACPHCGCPVTQPPVIATDSDTPPQPSIPNAWTQKPVAQPQGAEGNSSTWKVLAWVAAIVVFWLFVRSCASEHDASPTVTKNTAVVIPQAPPPVPKGPGEAEKSSWAATLDDEKNSAAAREAVANKLIKNFPDSKEGQRAASELKSLRKAVAYEQMGRQWSYDASSEGMSGKSVRTAWVYSSNTINLGFPYQGEQHAKLLLRRHPRWGNDVMLLIEQGQVLCHSYGDCYVAVRFDDEKLRRYEGNPPSDNSSESIFIPAFGTFMKKLPGAKKLKIEIQIYQAGNQVFEFDVSGFKPEKFK
jgi:hypothetical protein